MNWISTSFPPLTEEERQEYDMLKASSNWLCICCSKPLHRKKVRFCSAIKVLDIDTGPFDSQEYIEARIDFHQRARMNFKVDILRAERILTPILAPEHREKIVAKCL